MNAYWLMIPLIASTFVGCANSLKNIDTGIPNCPPPHLKVDIKEGTISGQDLLNLIENHIEDHMCIEKLKAMLGKKFKPNKKYKITKKMVEEINEALK